MIDSLSSFYPTCSTSSSRRTKLVTATAQNASKAALALNVSSHSIHVPLIHGRTHFLDSTHPCLNVDEILRIIVGELIASGGKATAAGLACCCKCFEDPVLDVLWATQDQLLPLLKTFPGDVWGEDECTVSTPTTSFFSLTIRLESLSVDSLRRWNGLVSGSTLEGWKCLNNVSL